MSFYLHIAGVGAVGAAEVFVFCDFFVDDKLHIFGAFEQKAKDGGGAGLYTHFFFK